MSIALDLIRGCAALVVLAGHAVQLKLYTGPYPFSAMAQHNAVIVFFVLSGLVIASSAQREGVTLPGFVIARTARILPVSVTSIGFAAFAYGVGTWLGASVTNPEAYDAMGGTNLLLPLLFLSEATFGSGPTWNPPYWSLCYEVWFYALFAVERFLEGRRRILILILIALLAGPKVLLLLPVWLVGVWLAGAKVNFESPGAGALWIGFSVACAVVITGFVEPIAAKMLLITGLLPEHFGFSLYAVSDLLLALAVAAGFIGLRPLATRSARLLSTLERPIRGFAGMSFTLYLFHWPMLCLLLAFGIEAQSSAPAFAALLAAVAVVCAGISSVTEGRREKVQHLLERALAAKLASNSDDGLREKFL